MQAADQIQLRCVDIAAVRVQHAVVPHIDRQHLAENDGPVDADIDDDQAFALEGDRRFGDAGRLDVQRRRGGEPGLLQFVDALGEVDGGDVHRFGQRVTDQVDNVLTGAADVPASILDVPGAAAADPECQHRRVAGHGVEEGEGCGVDRAIDILGGDPGDRARADGGGEQLVNVLIFGVGEIEQHGCLG